MIVTWSVKGKPGIIPKVQMSLRNVTYYFFTISLVELTGNAQRPEKRTAHSYRYPQKTRCKAFHRGLLRWTYRITLLTPAGASRAPMMGWLVENMVGHYPKKTKKKKKKKRQRKSSHYQSLPFPLWSSVEATSLKKQMTQNWNFLTLVSTKYCRYYKDKNIIIPAIKELKT